MNSQVQLALKWAVGAFLALLAVLVVTVPMNEMQQWQFAGATIAGVVVMSRFKGRKTTIAIGLLSILVSTRYIFWRTTATLSFGAPLEAALGTGLYLAELYAWVILVLGFVQTSWPLNRPVVEIDGPPESWPKVDVFIPTYNESLSIVRNTVFAAMDMDYPSDRFNVYILDDGKRPEFRAFARQVGCGYITRDNNLHAKAGNMNAAMTKTDGELIAIFDCDHVPVRSFLQLSVGWFGKDPKLALMQTPHHMYSPDPVQRNLGAVKDLPGEGDLFYGPVQGGNDLWNAAFFCGSCAIIRREALMMTNGFAGETVTEDAHTALKLQRMGWNTAYLEARLSAGLATERLVLHVGQRIRWARGMTQILRIDCPLLGKGLSFSQRLCYLNAMMHFQYPLPRIVFLTSPLAYLIFGQNIIQASASLIFAFSAPHLFCSSVSSERTQGGYRRPFWGEVYETILAFHLVKPTVMTWFQPRKGKFNVTDKGDLLDQSFFDWAIVKPHIICISLLFGAVSLGWIKLLFFKSIFNIQMDTLVLNTAWASFSLVVLLAAVSVARESRQTRKDIRIHAQLPVSVYLKSGHVVDAVTEDISMGGAAVILPSTMPVKDPEITHIALAMADERLVVPVNTVRIARGRGFVQFHPLDTAGGRRLVRAVMGRSDAWQPDGPPKAVRGLRSLSDIIAVDWMTLKRMLGLNGAERKRMKIEREQAARMREVAAKEAAHSAAAAKAIEAAASAAQAAHGDPAAAGMAPAIRVRRPGGVARAALAALALMVAGTLAAPRDASAQNAPAAPVAATAAADAATAAAPVASAGGAVRHEHWTLKDLHIKTPIRLAGTRGEIGIPFGIRRNDVVTDATITLRLAWSPALLGDVSQMVVLLNGEVVQTIPLRPGDSGGQTLKLPINPALFLPGDNQLNLRLIGHYARDCEDPFHSTLWANVSNIQSGFDLTIQSLPKVPDLSRLPGPFFDRLDNGPLKVPFVFAASPSHGELEAAASVASWFGSMASYRGFSFKPVWGNIPAGNAVVFVKGGTSIPGVNMAVNGPMAAMVRNPSDSNGMLLVIGGRNDGELRLAAAALVSARGVLGGPQMAFDNARIPTYPRYGAPRWITTDHPVRLGDIMEPFAMVGMGLPPGPMKARFRVAPDLFFWPRNGGTLDLGYRYPDAPWLEHEASRLDISLNGQYLKSMPLNGLHWWQRLFTGSGTANQDSRGQVMLPRYALFGQNELVFDYNLLMADKKKCVGTLPDNVRVGLDPNSTIDLSHAYHALMMPDLSTFAGAGYPFTVRPDLAETVVVMDATPSPAAVEAFLNLMGRFGDATGVAATGITVMNGLDADQLSDRDVLVLGSSQLAQAAQVFANAPVRYEGGTLHVRERSPLQFVMALLGGWGANAAQDVDATAYTAKGFSGIVSFESPLSSGRSVVAVLADDPTTLPQLIEGMNDDKINAQVQGDLSVVTGDGMSSFAVGPRYWVGTLPIWMKVAYWFSQRPLLMAVSALIVALALAGPVYVLLRNQARRRLAAAGTGEGQSGAGNGPKGGKGK